MLVPKTRMNPNVYTALGKLANRGTGCVGCVGTLSSNWMVWALAGAAMWFAWRKRI